MPKNFCDFCQSTKGGLYKFDIAFNEFIYVCPDCLSKIVVSYWKGDLKNNIVANISSYLKVESVFPNTNIIAHIYKIIMETEVNEKLSDV